MSASCGLCKLEFGAGTARAFPCGHVACIRCVEERAREGPGTVCPYCGKACKLDVNQLLEVKVDSFGNRVWCTQCDAAAADDCLQEGHALAALPALQRRAAEELAGVQTAAAASMQRLADLIGRAKEHLLQPKPPAGLLETRAKLEAARADAAKLKELLPEDVGVDEEGSSQPLQAVLALLRNWQAKRLAEAAAQADGLRDEHELEGALQLREAELAVREDDLRKKEEALSHKEAELGALAESLQGLQEEQQQRAKQIAVLEGHDDGGPDGAAAANDSVAEVVELVASGGGGAFPRIRMRVRTPAGSRASSRETRSRSRSARKARESASAEDDGLDSS